MGGYGLCSYGYERLLVLDNGTNYPDNLLYGIFTKVGKKILPIGITGDMGQDGEFGVYLCKDGAILSLNTAGNDFAWDNYRYYKLSEKDYYTFNMEMTLKRDVNAIGTDDWYMSMKPENRYIYFGRDTFEEYYEKVEDNIAEMIMDGYKLETPLERVSLRSFFGE